VRLINLHSSVLSLKPGFLQPARAYPAHTMYLINCNRNYALDYYHSPVGVKYLILSHTWGDDEVSFTDMTNVEQAKTKKGFGKIKGICDIAKRDGVTYAWVDTCCIDKSSSAELSESINSMYHWYQCAARCIVFLEDLETGNGDATEHQLRLCRWFTRGWTLQELIAPASVLFFDQQWNERGTKTSLGLPLSRITRIDNRVLQGILSLHRVAVAQRMSWAARRETTRIEDMAYCLLGIFGVNMPLLYGEREKAFVRLQQAVLLQTDDLSIFAWDFDGQQDVTKALQLGYIEAIPFAPRPGCFRACDLVERFDSQILPSPSITVTSAGVQLSACITNDENQFLHLQCKAVPDPKRPDRYSILAISLAQVPHGYMRRSDTFHAINPSLLHETFQDPTNICLVSGAHFLSMLSTTEINGPTELVVRFEPGQDMPVLDRSYYPQHLWYPGNSCFFAEWSDSFLGAIEVMIPAAMLSRTGSIFNSGAKCWVLCGMARAQALATEPGHQEAAAEWRTWSTVLLESEDGTIPGLAPDFQSARLRNPYTLCNVAHMLRTDLRDKHVDFPTTCTVPYDDKVISFEIMANTKPPRHREVIIHATAVAGQRYL